MQSTRQLEGSDTAKASREPGPTTAPHTWVVLGDKAGDNAQVEAAVAALGWTCARKHVHVREPFLFAKPPEEPALYHIDLEKSDRLEPPWPELIITIGRRPTMVALWIQQQSGGRSKIVLFGKPSSALRRFDLVISSAETQLPPLPNVLRIGLPLMRIDETAIADAATAWRPRLADLPRPLMAILVGGPTGPYRFDRSVVERLTANARNIMQQGGTPYFTTSRRTPPETVTALKQALPATTPFFEWRPESAKNPYRGLLGLADGFLVTGDSISMMVEVVRLRRPLAILSLPLSPVGRLDQLRRSFARWLFASGAGGPRRTLASAAYRSGLLTQTRDFTAFHEMLVAQDLAVWAGQGFQPPRSEVPDDLGQVVSRIRSLVVAS